MRLYVKHCPEACPERRPLLEQHLKERGFTDVHWVTEFSVNNPFVPWVFTRLGKRLSLAGVSGLVGTLEALQRFVDDPTINSAMFCDDDVVFIKDWEQKLNIPPGIPFINASVGVNFHILPDGCLQQLGNNGGCEVAWMTKDFARVVLDNVDVRSGLDHVFFALLRMFNIPLLCSPVAQQTSILLPKKPVIEHVEKPHEETWSDFLIHFKPTGIKYLDLWNESGYIRQRV
jgi:hypothetical protein